MQTKKRRTRLSWYDNKPKRVKPKQLATVVSSPAAKAVQPDNRPLRITGYDNDGRVVAEDRTDFHGKADQIATAWRESGLTVSILEN